MASNVRAYICRDPVDMRKAIDGLSYLVEPLLSQKPASGNLFVFGARDRPKVKIPYWQLVACFDADFVESVRTNLRRGSMLGTAR
jgi:IS66 Orf2 like protein